MDNNMYIQADRIVTFGKAEHRDARSATLSVVESTPGRKPNIKNPVEQYGYRQAFYRPEYNLIEIGTIEDVESMVRQSFQKKTALMFKEGEKFTGKNTETLKYIKARIKQIEYASGISWRNLLRETGYALISRSNFFWVKVRSKNASGGRSIAGVAPVAAYFPMAAEYVTIKRDPKGKILKYRQEINGKVKEFSPRDIIHFHAYKKPGYLFGTPSITPVKDDIRALRRIEENVELLIYQTLFPIFQYKVGTETKPATDVRLPDGHIMSEVDYVRQQIEFMPAEGGIVTPERHSIEYIGAEKAALKAREYLDYFKQRVISGLGLSGVDLGDGNTANRATADSMSRSLVDSVKDYQDILEDFINHQVFQELLLESEFKFDVLDDDHCVHFKFKEVDIEQQMKENVNAQVMYNGNILTVNEAREVAGKEPLTEAEEEMMFHNRVTMTQVEAQQKNMADSAAAQANNMQKPTNQHGTKTGPQKSRQDYVNKDSFLSDTTRLLKSDIVDHLTGAYVDKQWVGVMADTAKDSVIKKYAQVIRKTFNSALSELRVPQADKTKLSDMYAIDAVSYMTVYVEKYFKDVKGKVARIIDNSLEENKVDAVNELIQSIKYRADFIDKTERMRAYNYGKAIGLSYLGFKKAEINKDTECAVCAENDYTIDLTNFSIDTIPPYHPNSIAKITNGIS